MVSDRLTDGVRIAQLLASEVSGNEGRLRSLTVTDADPDVEPTVDGAVAYRICTDDGPVATAYVQPERVRLSFSGAPDAVAETAREAGLRVRPKASTPPQTLVFLVDGAAVKRVLPTLAAAAQGGQRD